MRREAHEALNTFNDALESLVDNHLSEVATPDEVNEYYGYHRGHPIADILQELDEDRAKIESAATARPSNNVTHKEKSKCLKHPKL